MHLGPLDRAAGFAVAKVFRESEGPRQPSECAADVLIDQMRQYRVHRDRTIFQHSFTMRRLLALAAPLHIHSAVDVEHSAGDVAGFLAGEKLHGGGYVFRLAEAL